MAADTPESGPGPYRIPGPIEIELDEPGQEDRVISLGGREQDESIRDRSQLLFEEEDEELATTQKKEEAGEGKELIYRPFQYYLRTTPASPLGQTTKNLLYTVFGILAVLLVAALIKRGT